MKFIGFAAISRANDHISCGPPGAQTRQLNCESDRRGRALISPKLGCEKVRDRPARLNYQPATRAVLFFWCVSVYNRNRSCVGTVRIFTWPRSRYAPQRKMQPRDALVGKTQISPPRENTIIILTTRPPCRALWEISTCALL